MGSEVLADVFARRLDGTLDHVALREQASALLRDHVDVDLAVWAVLDPATLMWASCVLDGMPRDADEALVEAGGSVHVPAGTPHRYRNPTDQPARMLVVTSGADQVAFLQGMSALTADGAADPAAVAAHTAAHGVRILAPAGA